MSNRALEHFGERYGGEGAAPRFAQWNEVIERLLAAESIGLGTVYIGALRNQPEAVAAELGLPDQVFATFGLCVGWPDPAAPASIKPRLPQEVVLHHEQYGAFERKVGAIDGYDKLMERFYARERMGVQGSWSRHSAARVASAQALRGRDRLRAALAAMGFRLQ